MEELILLLDYLRMVAYGTVIITATVSLLIKRRFSYMLYIGDIFLAIGYLTARLYLVAFNPEGSFIKILVLTPTILIWAGIHFYAFYKKD